MYIKQLDPPLSFSTTKGDAYAHFVIDYGMEEHLHWVCFLDASGECWTFKNPHIKLKHNFTKTNE